MKELLYQVIFLKLKIDANYSNLNLQPWFRMITKRPGMNWFLTVR